MGRYEVVEHPTKLPAVDYVTNSGIGPFIDTGRDITFGERIIGHLYLSESTVREMAQELGITSTATQKQIQAAYMKGKIDALKEGLGDDLVRVVDVLTRWLGALDAGHDVDLAGEVAQR